MRILSLTVNGRPIRAEDMTRCEGTTVFENFLRPGIPETATLRVGDIVAIWRSAEDVFLYSREDGELRTVPGAEVRRLLAPETFALLRPATPETAALFGRLREARELLDSPPPATCFGEDDIRIRDALGPYGAGDMIDRLRRETERRHQEAVARERELRLLESVQGSQRFAFFRTCYESSLEKLRARLEEYIETGERCRREYSGFFGWLRRREGPPAYLRTFVMRDAPLTGASLEGLRQDCLLCRDIIAGLDGINIEKIPPAAPETAEFLERAQTTPEEAIARLRELENPGGSALAEYEAERDRRRMFLKENGWEGGELSPEDALRRVFGQPRQSPIDAAGLPADGVPHEWRLLYRQYRASGLPFVVCPTDWNMELPKENPSGWQFLCLFA